MKTPETPPLAREVREADENTAVKGMDKRKEPSSDPKTAPTRPYTIFGKQQKRVLTVLLVTASLTSPFTQTIYLPLLTLLAERYAVSDNTLLMYKLDDGTLVVDPIDWARKLQGRYGDKLKSKSPTTATFKAEMSTLAVVYRGQDINRDKGLADDAADQVASVNLLAFSQSPNSSLLVASYTLADLVLFDIRLKDVRHDPSVQSQFCSAEPAALLRREIETESLRTPSTYSHDSHEDVIDRNDDNASMVTALACHEAGSYLVGRNDATVWLFDAEGMAVVQLFKLRASITKLGFYKEKSHLISVDTAGYLVVHHMQKEQGALCAKEVYSHHSPGTGIQHSIMNQQCDCIFTCANDVASIFAMPGGNALSGPIEHNPEVSYTFTNHPTNSDVLISAHSQTLRLYSWQNLTSVNASSSIGLLNELEPDMQLRGLAPILNNTAVILNYSGHGPQVNPRTFSIPNASILPASHEVKVIAQYQAACDQMEYYIGSYRNREVFLSTDGWICSADKDIFRARNDILHHFMPPSD